MSTVVEYVPKDPAPIAEQDGGYVSDNGEIKATFGQDSQGQHVVEFEARGYTIRWTPRDVKYIDPDLGIEDIIVSADQTSPLWVLRDYHARYDRHFPDVEEWFRVEAGKLKHYFSLRGDQRPPLPILDNPYLAVSGVLEYDPSLSVCSMGQTMTGAFQASDPISLVDADGREVFTLPAIVAWDQSSPAQVQRGTFFVEEVGQGRLAFSIGVPYAWLSRSDVSYPVVIDPTVIVDWSTFNQIRGNNNQRMVVLPNGRIYTGLAYVSGGYVGNLNVYYSDDGGQTWASAGSCFTSNTYSLNFAMASKGTMVYVLTIQYCNSTSGGTSRMTLWTYDDAVGGPWTSHNVTDNNGIISHLVIEQSTTVSLALDSNGVIGIALAASLGGQQSQRHPVYISSTDGGTTWVGVALSTGTSGPSRYNPCLTYDSQNNPMMVFEYADSTTPKYMIVLATKRFTTRGAGVVTATGWGDSVVYSDSAVAQYKPVIVLDNSDIVSVAWNDNGAPRNVFATRSTDGGLTFGARINVSNATEASDHQENATLYVTQGGDLHLFWQGVDPVVAAQPYQQLRKAVYSGGAWGAPATLTAYTTGYAQWPSAVWSKYNLNDTTRLRYSWLDTQDNKLLYDSISLNSPPNAPILTQHSNFDATTAQTFQWSFSDPNQGDSQSAYQMQIVDVATGQTVKDTGKVASTAQSYTLPAGTLANGKRYQWRVMTWDQQGAQSPWSSYSTFETAAGPSVQITSPTAGATVPGSSVTVQWSYSDPAGNAQQTYQVQLLDPSGATVLWDSGQQSDPQGAARALTLGYVLQNGVSYKVRVTVTNSKGIAATSAAVTFTTSFTQPAVPTVTAMPQDGFIRLSITNPAPSGSQPTVAYNDLYRRPAGNTIWTRIATNLPSGGTYDDYAVASGQSYEYKVTAVGNNGTTSDSNVVTASITLHGAWIHVASNPAGTIHRFPYDGEGRSVDHNLTATMMAFEGRTFPVADIADQETQSIKITVQCLRDSNDLQALRNLLAAKQTVLYRDSRGRKLYGIISALPERDERWGTSVDLTIQAVDYQEVV